jgi:hypothetical protein
MIDLANRTERLWVCSKIKSDVCGLIISLSANTSIKQFKSRVLL